MHAVAIGPKTLKPQQWLPPIWGLTQDQGMVPAGQSLKQINRILELVMRHFNSIIGALEDERPDISPHWCVMVFDGRGWCAPIPDRLAKLEHLRRADFGQKLVPEPGEEVPVQDAAAHVPNAVGHPGVQPRIRVRLERLRRPLLHPRVCLRF